MLTGSAQRWNRKRDSYRPAGEPIDPRRYEVAPIPGDNEAKAFVTDHHYSGSYPSARERVGLYRGPELVGVAVFSCPANYKALDPAPGDNDSRVELGRFVLLDDVPANGESWFIARCFELLRAAGYTGVVSFSDPVPRTDRSGDIVFGGHIGTIYQATNGVYLGRSSARTNRMLPDGTVLHARTIAKIRSRDRGWRYAAAMLEAHGADPLGEDEDAVTWLARWIPQCTRATRHAGNLKYAWALRRGDRRFLPESRPYEKIRTQGAFEFSP